MKWPIRNQILFPLAALQIVAVGSIALAAAYLAAQRAERTTTTRLRQVVETLGSANFPFTPTVLEKMRGLSGAHFLALDETGGVLAATLPIDGEFPNVPVADAAQGPVRNLAEYPPLQFGGSEYFAARIQTAATPSVDSLLVLYPVSSWQAARWEAAFPPLAIGGAALLLMIGISAWVADRIGRRIRRVESQVAQIAAGDFTPARAGALQDEVQALVASVNHMCEALRRMQTTIRETERAGLVSQLASGLAHQLRNSLTGARLAVQIHRQRRPGCAGDESLDVALRQLTLTEEQVKGLLSLHENERRAAVAGDVKTLIEEAASLVRPAAAHAHVAFDVHCELPVPAPVADSDSIRAALLNLLLNAIEAAGGPNSHGAVRLAAEMENNTVRICVADNGPGIPEELRQSVFDPFVTTKPEGVGLGLALARKAAVDHGGSLSTEREGNETVFTLCLPMKSLPAIAAPSPDDRKNPSARVLA